LGVLCSLALMLSLPVLTWIRFLVWLDLGMLIYWLYGRRHSPLADAQELARRSNMSGFANLVTILGALVVFNGFFMTLLGALTEFNVLNPAMVKWEEIHVSAHQADMVGLAVLASGAVLFGIGMLLRKGSAPKAA
jgi:hypothetical protein